jgi:multiple sugar transport system permease protein
VSDRSSSTRAAAAGTAQRARSGGWAIPERYNGYLFITPAFLLLMVILGFPAVAAVLQSLNLMWVREPGLSLASYRALPADPEFRRALVNTVVFVGATIALHLTIGFAVAMLLNQDVPAKWFFRIVTILPWTMPDVIGGLIWRFMFDTLPGIVNALLIVSGAIAEPVDWLGRPRLAFMALILAEAWRGYPFVMLILLAGLQSVPRVQYEAAWVDGATGWQTLRYITLPNLKRMFYIALVLDTVWECRLFGMVYSMTGGGPGDATQVLSLLTYKQYFQFFNVSYAGAIAVILALTLLAISFPYLRMSMQEKV